MLWRLESWVVGLRNERLLYHLYPIISRRPRPTQRRPRHTLTTIQKVNGEKYHIHPHTIPGLNEQRPKPGYSWTAWIFKVVSIAYYMCKLHILYPHQSPSMARITNNHLLTQPNSSVWWQNEIQVLGAPSLSSSAMLASQIPIFLAPGLVTDSGLRSQWGDNKWMRTQTIQ